MANYKNYAENLIGNWEKDIYEPQKDITKAIYQTNWNKLTNDYNTVKEKLARNFKLAREEYANTLNDVQNSSFNRMNNANIDLANRGLSNSGMMDLITQADTQSKGEDVDKALASLLNTNNASLSGLAEGVIDLGSGQNSLASGLSGDIGKLTDADAANMQQYGGLLGSLGENAAGRAASRASSGGSGKSKKEEEQNDIYRRMGIIDTLNDTTLSDVEKKQILAINYDVSSSDADDMLNSYKYKALVPKLESRNNDLAEIIKRVNNLNAYVSPIPEFDYIQRNNRLNSQLNNTQKDVDALNKELSKYTYYDLWDILNR